MPDVMGRILITPLSMLISWISKRREISDAPPIKRSGTLPVLVSVKYPPPTAAPFGVARDQAAESFKPPIVTSSARAGSAAQMAKTTATMETILFISTPVQRLRHVRTTYTWNRAGFNGAL